ncbi:gonadotropin-releasing hormone 3 [Astyanax mexicanus]|uniref:Progonadoliberin n=3 Tax=Astyanax TaxID=7993 RepID=A0A8B9LJ39_ASTMX|nr:gonadotropin-releasing hormone 3 [Astyanax mexicanus]ALA56113.1 gonadotropin-releasing-hormone GnRH3 preproprotein [Astyanax altiparanae]KAG9268228.1 progonadoliberin-3-like [Astyanax mexicanus]
MTNSVEWNWRVVVGLLVLACVVEVGVCQHWSYGWMPGGKRSVGELEATFRMMDAGDAVVALPLNSPLQQITPLQTINEEDSEALKKKRISYRRRGRAE